MKKLAVYLKEQRLLYEELLKKAQNKQEAIVKNNLELIEALNREEDKLIIEISAAEKERIRYIEDNPEIFGADVLKMTMEELKKVLPEDILPDFEQETEMLLGVLKELKAINAENAELIKQALRIINVTINTIAGAEGSPGYGRDNNTQAAKNRNLFDRKI